MADGKGRARAMAPIVGVSDSLARVRALVERVAASDCPVLIEGESGTGKELIARHLHDASPRRDRVFIPVNCASASPALFESQFFGHVRGAFTGAQQDMLGWIRSADRGVLFLDEVSEIPLGHQAKLLRILQDGEVTPVGLALPVRVDVRFIAATNCTLRQEVSGGRFRDDLFYRLNVVSIVLEPLRSRPEDIPSLLDHFSSALAPRYHRPPIRVGPEVERALCGYAWPGNVRELASWVERLYVTGLEPAEAAALLIAEADTAPEESAPQPLMTLQEAERLAIRRAMEASGHNQQEAARFLAIHRNTLARKLRQPRVA